MQLVLAALLTFSIGLLVFHFVLYPALLWAVWRVLRQPAIVKPAGKAMASLVIAAHNEAPIIVERLKNALAQTMARTTSDFELILVSDGSSDGTANLARTLDDRRLTVIELDERRGKAHALNIGAAAARGDIIVFSDANALFAEDSVEALMHAFDDPAVGVASGDITTRAGKSGTGQAIGAAEGVYWRYESFIRRLESDITSTVSVVGPLLAVSRAALEPMPQGIINDDAYRALSALKAGWRVVYVPAARCRRLPSSDHRQELERRKRIAAGRYQQLAQPGLWPVNRPVVLSFWIAHKILRLIAPFLMAIALASNIVLVISGPQSIAPAALLALQAAFYGLGAIGMSAPRGSRAWLLPVAIASFLRVMAGNLAGFGRFVAGGQSVLWAKAER
jgi:cellulose synthase/poly-beta-1,6-N-acetylglucosamine synthase-like glycosyltransferase